MAEGIGSLKYMLDTNICVYAIQGGNEHLDRRFGECEAGDLVMSAVTPGSWKPGLRRAGIRMEREGTRPRFSPTSS